MSGGKHRAGMHSDFSFYPEVAEVSLASNDDSLWQTGGVNTTLHSCTLAHSAPVNFSRVAQDKHGVSSKVIFTSSTPCPMRSRCCFRVWRHLHISLTLDPDLYFLWETQKPLLREMSDSLAEWLRKTLFHIKLRFTLLLKLRQRRRLFQNLQRNENSWSIREDQCSCCANGIWAQKNWRPCGDPCW